MNAIVMNAFAMLELFPWSCFKGKVGPTATPVGVSTNLFMASGGAHVNQCLWVCFLDCGDLAENRFDFFA